MPSKVAGMSETELVLITGMSGGGRKTAANVLEELGWYVADNLPPELITQLVELSTAASSPVKKLAIVTDVRSMAFPGSLSDVLQLLDGAGHKPFILFMDADNDSLIKRFDTVRRKHPLQGDETLMSGIERERELLEPIRERADAVIDTSALSVHDLFREIESILGDDVRGKQHVVVQSFGFKNGAPKDTDVLLDARFLPNPYWVPELRGLRGTDPAVSNYVLNKDGVPAYVDSAMTMFGLMLDGYRREGKTFVTISVGCTGGHHRSVALVEEFARRFRAQGDVSVTVLHRDIARG